MVEATPDGYANELRREITRSEIQRVRVLAVILVALLALTLGAVNLLPGLIHSLFHQGLAWWLPLAGIGPFALYEVVVLFVLRWRASRDREFPRFARFGNAFIETSMPSVLIFTLAHHMPPEAVFGFWPPLLYFVFILLSTLRLDFWLSLWTGAVAAVQQFLLVLQFVPMELFSEVPAHSLLYNLSRSIVLMGCGVIAGIVAGGLR